MSKAAVPPGVDDLTTANRTSPAEQDERRSPGGGVPSKCYYTGTVRIPGYGHKPDRCRPLQPVGFCEESAHLMLGRSSCGTRYCPDHWRDWIEDAVTAAVARLAAFRHVQEGAGKRLAHAMVSPDPDSRRWSADAFWDARSETYDVLRDVGCRGGFTVAHPFRSSDLGDLLFETAVETGEWEEDRGKWSLFRDAADDFEELKPLIEPGPHSHSLTFVEDFDPEAAPDGYVVKNIRTLDRFHFRDVESYREMVKPAYYLLTHAGTQDDRQSVTYWGDVHPASFDPEEELSAARWEQIQQYARAAVTTAPGESPLDAGSEDPVEETECPHEGCESEIVPIDELSEYVEDEEWVAEIEHEQLLQLRGVQVWATMGDRPPPSTAGREEAMLQWLRSTGRTHYDPAGELAPEIQVGLGDFGVNVHGGGADG